MSTVASSSDLEHLFRGVPQELQIDPRTLAAALGVQRLHALLRDGLLLLGESA